MDKITAFTVRLLAIIFIAGAAFTLLWWFAFFTNAGNDAFTGASAFAGRTQLLSAALASATRAGGGPGPALLLNALAMFFPFIGSIAYGMLSRRNDPPVRDDGRGGSLFDGIGRFQMLIVTVALLAHIFAGFPVLTALLGSAILVEPGPALLASFLTLAAMAASLAINALRSHPSRS